MERKAYEQVREKLRREILAEVDYSKETDDAEIMDRIDAKVIAAYRESGFDLEEMKRLRSELFHSIRRLDVLQDLLEDPDITEIMINGPQSIFVERHGTLEPYAGSFASREKLEDVIQQIVSSCNRVVNAASPIVDARLPDGDRVNVVLAPVALDGPIVTIRRFPARPIRMEDLLSWESIDEDCAAFLRRAVQAGMNLFISGGTGSGKTTFLGALSNFIPADERVITIEDNAELQIRHIQNLVRLECRSANVEGCREITIRDLIRTSLRMRPDRIIVGEVRGSEAIDMISAMNTGHDGSMSTGHANSARDMLSRLETMILMGMDLPLAAIRGQLASGLDLLVHLGRLRDGSRRLLEISEVRGLVQGEIGLRTLYRFSEKGERNGRIVGTWTQEGELENTEKLRRHFPKDQGCPPERTGGGDGHPVSGELSVL